MERGLKGFDGIEFTIVDEVFFVLLEHRNKQLHQYNSKKGLYCFCALGSLIYGTVLTACYVLFEYGRWNFAEVPVDVSFQFYRLANGPIGLISFIIQVQLLMIL